MEERSETKELLNGVAWLEYRTFEEGRFDVMFYDLEFSQDMRVDLGLVDLERKEIDARWFYSLQEELEVKEASEEEFSRLLEENFPEYDYRTDFVSIDEVSYNVLSSPKVYGDVLVGDSVQKGLIDRELSRFEEVLLGQARYTPVWVEGEEIYE